MLPIHFSSDSSIELQAQTLLLRGDVRLPHIEQLDLSLLRSLEQQVTLVDCRGLTLADSCTLAFLAYLQVHNSADFKVKAFPKNLMPLIKLYDLESVIDCMEA